MAQDDPQGEPKSEASRDNVGHARFDPKDVVERKDLRALGLDADSVAKALLGKSAFSEMQKALSPLNELQERMARVAELGGLNSSLSAAAKQIAEQKIKLDSVKSILNDVKHPALSSEHESPLVTAADRLHLEIPENPSYETNERLARIEEQFDQLHGIAVDAAQIANSLQAAAVEFLAKFESAASDNERSASRAIRLGAIAVVIAVAMPAAQILYTEFWRVPSDSAAMDAALQGMKTEIVSLREAQSATSERLAEALANSDQEIAKVLREIADSLATADKSQIEAESSH